ncbi:MAG: hypothetical protein HY699_03500 [Deltaproteobacteria bacterium]|nr:hypothetical protein [Deltaproteobacteria bacterium]
MTDELSDLPLFSGPHIPRVRFENALARLDVRAAVADTPAQWREAVTAMAMALGTGGPARADLEGLRRAWRPGWPLVIERTWQRLVGLRLDAHKIPRSLDGEPAAAFLLRGGDVARAELSLRRHLAHQPHDARAWELFADFEPVRGAARCAFHGGPVLEAAVAALLDAIAEDELPTPPGPWLLAYGWFAHKLDLDDIARAVSAEGEIAAVPLPVIGDAKAFAWYLLDAGGRPLGHQSVGVIEARARLQRISPAAFRRYLARVERKGL